MNHGYKSSILVLIFCSYIRFALIALGTIESNMRDPFRSLISSIRERERERERENIYLLHSIRGMVHMSVPDQRIEPILLKICMGCSFSMGMHIGE